MRYGEGASHGLFILNRVSQTLNASVSVTEALERVLESVAELLALHSGWVWLLDETTHRYYSAATRNLPPYLQDPTHMSGIACRCIATFEAGKLTSHNVAVFECSRLQTAIKAKARSATDGLRYHASIPLYSRGKPLGIMNVTGPECREMSEEELAILSAIADQVGIAIERASLAETSAHLARAEERSRLARDIHDTLAQGLTAIALHLDAALGELDRDPARARTYIERALVASRANLDDARRSVLSLRARYLEDAPLAAALAALARTFTSETGIRVTTTLNAKHPIAPQAENELFRIAQEALSNVRLHAAAHTAQIALRTTARSAVLTIGDDGKGFLSARVRTNRQGLSGMRERARLLGGVVRIRTAPGDGTTITASIPIGLL